MFNSILFIWTLFYITKNYQINGQQQRTHFPAQSKVIQCELNSECRPIIQCENQAELKLNPNKLHYCGWRHGLPMICCRTKKSSNDFSNKFYRDNSLSKNISSKMKRNFEICGTRIKQISMYIVGGNQVLSNTKYPWYASLALLKDDSYLTDDQNNSTNLHPYCGATILTDNFLVSSAHCFPINNVDNLDLANYRIGVGNIELSKMDIHEIEHVFIHPNASIENHYFDICLIKLKNRLKFNSRIRPICLPFLELNSNEDVDDQDNSRNIYKTPKHKENHRRDELSRDQNSQMYGYSNPFYGFRNSNYHSTLQSNQANFNLRMAPRQFNYRNANRYLNDNSNFHQFRFKRSNGVIRFEQDDLYNDLLTKPSTLMYIAGFGDTSFMGSRAQVLREADQLIIDKKKCNELYMKLASPALKQGLNKEFICAADRRLAKRLNDDTALIDPRTSRTRSRPNRVLTKRSISYWLDYFSNRIKENNAERMKRRGLIRSNENKQNKNDKVNKVDKNRYNNRSESRQNTVTSNGKQEDKKKKEEEYANEDLVNILTEEELRDKLVLSDACQGDSGGPMITQVDSVFFNKTMTEYKNNSRMKDKLKKEYDIMSSINEKLNKNGLEGKFMLVGIVSLGRQCGDKDYPGVYVSVNYHKDWIIKVLESDLNSNDIKYKL